MTSFGGMFGGVFGLPEIEGSDASGESGEPGRIVGLDLDGGVVHIRPAHEEPADTPADDGPEQ